MEEEKKEIKVCKGPIPENAFEEVRFVDEEGNPIIDEGGSPKVDVRHDFELDDRYAWEGNKKFDKSRQLIGVRHDMEDGSHVSRFFVLNFPDKAKFFRTVVVSPNGETLVTNYDIAGHIKLQQHKSDRGLTETFYHYKYKDGKIDPTRKVELSETGPEGFKAPQMKVSECTVDLPQEFGELIDDFKTLKPKREEKPPEPPEDQNEFDFEGTPPRRY